MSEPVNPQELAFEAYTLCSFVPRLPDGGNRTARAIPLVIIGYNEGRDPSFVWLVPKEGIDPGPHTNDPYYAQLLRDPHSYFRRKVAKYILKTGSVRRGIQMLIDCHQEHLSFTNFIELDGPRLTRPLEVELAC
ncbi:MAG: hypothetical protein JO101_02885 [Candidatus Eremiobacteraeota bacterium]|nr:hypothetical protein [Candidatus Eremiobacteraeota bacterium]MBV8354237.1 hypothetical protein [Candidatus Eremiobacteraeota bacterium]